MHSFFYWLLLIVALYPLQCVAAAEPEPSTAQQPTETENAPPETPAAAAKKPVPASVFIPTEDISEDAAVSYPVDI